MKAVYAVPGFLEAALEILITDFTNHLTFFSNQAATSSTESINPPKNLQPVTIMINKDSLLVYGGAL